MFALIYVLMSSLQDKTSGNNWNTVSHFLHGRRCIWGYRSGHMNTCYLISSTFSHHAGRVSTLDRHWSRSEKASLHVTTVSVSASIKALRQGCSLKSFLCYGGQRLRRGGRLTEAESWRGWEACSILQRRGCSALQATASASELPEQGSMFPGNKAICDDNLYLFNH